MPDNDQHPLRPCIKVTRVNGRGYEGARTRRERSPYGGRLALLENQGTTMISQMTDEKLLAATLAARRRAHDAPLASFAAENKNGKPTGHYFLDNHTTAFARHAEEWSRLAVEVTRRGLSQPTPDWDGDCRRR